MKIEQRLEELGVELPEPAVPVANYVTTVQTGNLIFTSGHGPGTGEGPIYKSQLGTDATIEEGYASAGHRLIKHAQTRPWRFGQGETCCQSGWVRQFSTRFY